MYLNLTFGELAQSELGPISFIAGDRGLLRLAYEPLFQLKQNTDLRAENPSLVGLETVGALLSELNEYLFGIRKAFSIRIDWQSIRGFQRDVLQLTMAIPYGEVRSYGEISRQLGRPGSARAVGRALSQNPMPIVIPCHRVVAADGNLRGYAAPNGIQTKAFLLNKEGLHIVNNRVLT